MTNAARQASANAAIALVEDGMRLGLGTGRAMAFVVAGLAGRRITGVATSAATAAQAAALGITLEDPDQPVDLAIDGADQVERRTLRLLKGGGGALLREKIVAETARRLVIVAEDPKLVDHLGQGFPLPVEIVPFGAAATTNRIATLGGAPTLRPGTTDNGNLILDCPGFAPIRDPFTLERQLRAIAGVVATGLFLMPVERALIGRPDGTVLELRP